MIIKNYKDQKVKDTPHKVDVRPLYNHENAQVMHMTFKAGESLIPHITPVDVFFYILEGKVTVRVGDDEVEVEKDNLVESPKDIIHNLSNNSDKTARVLVVKSPRPDKPSKLV